MADRNPSDHKQNLKTDMMRLEQSLAELRVQYEQYFIGVIPLAPEKLYQDVKNQIRLLMKAPFRTSALNFQLRALRNRFSSLDTYWQRVLREREDGTYHRDVFKANLRDKQEQQERAAQTPQGAAEKSMQNLFRTYQEALQKTNGAPVKLDFETFRNKLVARARDLKQNNKDCKVSFKVVMKEGKVSVQANLKPKTPPAS